MSRSLYILTALHFTLVKKLVPGKATPDWVGCAIRITFASSDVGVEGSSKEKSIFLAAPHETNSSALSYRLTCCSAKHASDFDCRVCMKLFWAIKWRTPPHPFGPNPSGNVLAFRTRFPRNGNEEEEEINAQRCICYGLRVCSVQQCVCMCEEATCSQCNLAPSLPL